jgi:uncharacterized protein YbjT (DUF2867 family)
MLMVTGANGNLGRQVVANLRSLVGPAGFVAGTRDPSTAFARELAASGVQVRRTDFDEPSTLAAAFEGIEAALIISTFAPNSVLARTGTRLRAPSVLACAGSSTQASPARARRLEPTTASRFIGRRNKH